jgi:hypothetical protein
VGSIFFFLFCFFLKMKKMSLKETTPYYSSRLANSKFTGVRRTQSLGGDPRKKHCARARACGGGGPMLEKRESHVASKRARGGGREQLTRTVGRLDVWRFFHGVWIRRNINPMNSVPTPDGK